MTRTGAQLMTPEYASPEQVRGQAITTVSDIYSLGVILYKLLTGRSPYTAKSHSLWDLERAICEKEPLKPSTAVMRRQESPAVVPSSSSVRDTPSATVPTELRPDTLRRRLRGDLDKIILRAMEKRPSMRYVSAEALSDDLGRYLGVRLRSIKKMAELFQRELRVSNEQTKSVMDQMKAAIEMWNELMGFIARLVKIVAERDEYIGELESRLGREEKWAN